MVRVVAGNEHVGIQGIYYFKDRDSAQEFAESFRPFLDSVRAGNDWYKIVLENYKNNETILNFFLVMKERCEQESSHPEVWYEPGGKFYGTNWENQDLPNGRGVEIMGSFYGEARISDTDFDTVYI